jgi:gas vesicle protein
MRQEEPFEEDAVLEDDEDGDRGRAGGFFAGLALGALLGVGAALFLNSSRGRRLSRRVRHELEDFRDEAGKEFTRRGRRLRHHAGRAAREAKDRLEDIFDPS